MNLESPSNPVDSQSSAAASAPPVVVRRIDGYRVYQRDESDHFWNLFRKFRNGELPVTRLGNHARERDVFLFEDGGRRYVLKLDHGGWGFGGESRPERFFLKLLRGPFYSRLMRRVRIARRAGCDVIQDIHLVAEKRTLHYCHEAVMILDYIEGVPLKEAGNYESHYPAMREAMLDLHSHGLALCDISYWNFLVTEQGIRMIDLVCRGNARVDRVKDCVRLKKVFGIELPLSGWFDRLLFRVLSGFQAARNRYAEGKNRKRPPKRLRYFRS